MTEVQVRDYKEVWNEAYYEAIDEGLPEEAAADSADEALADWQGLMTDRANG